MRTIFFMLFLIVFIVVLANIATIINNVNGIPDVFQMVFPEKYANTEEQKALQTGVVPFESDDANAPQLAVPQQVYRVEGGQDVVQVDLDTEKMYDPLAGSVVISKQLDIPHRNEAAVSAWVTEAMTTILTFTLPDYQTHMVEIDKFMAPNGMKEFGEFLETAKVLGLMQTKNFDLKAFVTDIPTLAASGVTRGSYRWVYDIPVNLTFLPVGAERYEGLGKDKYISETLTIRVQIGRVPMPEPGIIPDESPSGLLAKEGLEIETWDVLGKRDG